ncbi:MAG: sugar porter family MFS transporter [Hamadaea sp.]|uniref:sugar porter family MFS transporter n=1 Tax=Hamadaea sp. TaxID=2024425 RepID=UPI0017A25AEA|nr:sugar porter family MFS transporter [Hamadaea sp.]NUR70384.1 sugar porter family MFS transporter [Hamadaea sp.]NUT20544.1 sugar porter family MFS transporter [Hamadaea sp.]
MTAVNTPDAGILGTLDSRTPTRFYWSLTLLATIGGFLFGFDTSNIGSVLGFIPYELNDFWTGYLVAGASLGAAAGALAAGPLTDRFGRKALLVVDAAIYAGGALLSAFAPNAAVLIFARTLIGLAIGADSAIATAYIAEYAPAKRRGSLAMLQQWMITVGILAAYLIAWLIYATLPDQAATLDWRLILGLGAVPALVGFVLRTRMPESPRWLMRKGRSEDARRSLAALGVEVSTEQVTSASRELTEAEENAAPSRWRNWTPGVRRALLVVCLFFTFQQITGINVPFYYGPKVLGPLFQTGDSKLDEVIAGVQATTILTLVNVAATYFAFRWIDRAGRRPLAIGGFAGMAVFALVAGAGLSWFTGSASTAVVIVSLSLFIASFAIGVGGTGWLIQGEVFPTAIRGQAAAIAATVDWLANFALIEAFPALESGLGLAWVMTIFAALSVVAIVFVLRFLPETKHHSVEEITAIFERQASSKVQV